MLRLCDAFPYVFFSLIWYGMALPRTIPYVSLRCHCRCCCCCCDVLCFHFFFESTLCVRFVGFLCLSRCLYFVSVVPVVPVGYSSLLPTCQLFSLRFLFSRIIYQFRVPLPFNCSIWSHIRTTLFCFFSLFRFVAFFMRLTLGKYMCDWVKTGNMIRCVLCDTQVCVCVPY